MSAANSVKFDLHESPVPAPVMQTKQASPRAPAADEAVALPAVEPPMSLDSLPKGILPSIVKLAKSVAEQMVATSSANDSLAAMGAAHERAAVAEAELAVLQAKASKLQNDIAPAHLSVPSRQPVTNPLHRDPRPPPSQQKHSTNSLLSPTSRASHPYFSWQPLPLSLSGARESHGWTARKSPTDGRTFLLARESPSDGRTIYMLPPSGSASASASPRLRPPASAFSASPALAALSVADVALLVPPPPTPRPDSRYLCFCLPNTISPLVSFACSCLTRPLPLQSSQLLIPISQNTRRRRSRTSSTGWCCRLQQTMSSARY
jgi:hypothetical protein